MGDVTADFSMQEFLKSATAERLGLSNYPLPEHEENLRNVTIPLFQRIRDKLNAPIIITSGYRSPVVNKTVGGVANSAHALGLAGDASTPAMTAEAFAQFIAADTDLMADIDQVILESSRAVVHIGAGPEKRHQVFSQTGAAGTPFDAGIV